MNVSASEPELGTRVEDLLDKCNLLLKELEEFRNFVANSTQGRLVDIVDMRQYSSAINSELKSLHKVGLRTDRFFYFITHLQLQLRY